MTDPKKSRRGPDKFIIRLPSGMRDRIKADASRRRLSMNDVVLEALETRYPTKSLSGCLQELEISLRDMRSNLNIETVQTLTYKIEETLSDIKKGRIAPKGQSDE